MPCWPRHPRAPGACINLVHPGGGNPAAASAVPPSKLRPWSSTNSKVMWLLGPFPSALLLTSAATSREEVTRDQEGEKMQSVHNQCILIEVKCPRVTALKILTATSDLRERVQIWVGRENLSNWFISSSDTSKASSKALTYTFIVVYSNHQKLSFTHFLIIAVFTYSLRLTCWSSAWAKSFSPVFSTPLFTPGRALKGGLRCIGYKWDTRGNKWQLLSAACTLFEEALNTLECMSAFTMQKMSTFSHSVPINWIKINTHQTLWHCRIQFNQQVHMGLFFFFLCISLIIGSSQRSHKCPADSLNLNLRCGSHKS